MSVGAQKFRDASILAYLDVKKKSVEKKFFEKYFSTREHFLLGNFENFIDFLKKSLVNYLRICHFYSEFPQSGAVMGLW